MNKPIENPSNCISGTGRLLRVGDVSHLVGLSRSRIYALVSEGLFPAPIRLNAAVERSATAWVEGEIQAWIEERIAERDERLRRSDSSNGGTSSAAA